jgi:hypothetical protein
MVNRIAAGVLPTGMVRNRSRPPFLHMQAQCFAGLFVFATEIVAMAPIGSRDWQQSHKRFLFFEHQRIPNHGPNQNR